MRDGEIKKLVRDGYARVALQQTSCCGTGSTCCGSGVSARSISKAVGYSDAEMEAVPEGANLGLGCGNPTALASLCEGETVLDLGSGAGFDCFLAAGKVGASGRVIGVDMTPEMLERARANAAEGGYGNVEFRLGEIDNLPAADSSVNVIISNCVINLTPDKRKVFAEAFRVLKPGGRLMVSDIVLTAALPEAVRDSIEAYIGCVAGASLKSDYLAAIEAAGFRDIEIVEESAFPVDFIADDPILNTLMEKKQLTDETLRSVAATVFSAKVSALKPA